MGSSTRSDDTELNCKKFEFTRRQIRAALMLWFTLDWKRCFLFCHIDAVTNSLEILNGFWNILEAICMLKFITTLKTQLRRQYKHCVVLILVNYENTSNLVIPALHQGMITAESAE